LIPFDYIVLPAVGLSILVLIVVSLLTPHDPKEKWGKFYEEEKIELKDVV
jgi:SSS family solute:Na+ symporter/sodium/proline symporter